jgi:hypothetical protein
MTTGNKTKEQERLDQGTDWKKWGPYLSERQWGTVREDYSASGNAWSYFTHDQARSRAYRWGEDGLAGISDNRQIICFALALWNGKDPILKERLFGLTNSEGNHGEDVKEYYYYLDSTPTHSYMKYLYKYPQKEYPYMDLIDTNRSRERSDFEYELVDTGIFNDDSYFDVFVEYAKESPEDILVRITIFNRGKEAAQLHVLPTIWFRNTWLHDADTPHPQLRQFNNIKKMNVIETEDNNLGKRYLYCEGNSTLLFTENETNNERVFGSPNTVPFVKDGINNYVVDGDKGAVNPATTGTKAAAHYLLTISADTSVIVRLRLTDKAPDIIGQVFGAKFTDIFDKRRAEADKFYDSIYPDSLTADEKNIMRQALAGMLWTKQYYIYNVDEWLGEHKADFKSEKAEQIRNSKWFHMVNNDIISMPDKWEYPWYAAWDLAFHTLVLNLVDPAFAKQQLELMLRERYLHPNGQIPAYEWNFGDVNPPVHAWAIIFNYRLEKELQGEGDRFFLEHAFQKLLLNFTWWVNRKDRTGLNAFEGGFLGLDNIGVFDRNTILPGGGYLEQADGTAWMAMYCQNMLEIAIELALTNPAYEEMAIKFFEHFLWIAYAMDRMGINNDEMWDENDGFFYDLLRFPDGRATRLKLRSMVGLLALCACAVFPPDTLEALPNFAARARWFSQVHPELLANIHRPGQTGTGGRFLLALLNDEKLKRVLSRLLDEQEFLSPYGIRSLSRRYADQPYIFKSDGHEFRVSYRPAESDSGMFGGNSNWRGPIWFPTNALIIRALLNLYMYYGNSFTIECPTGSGNMMNLFEVSEEITNRLKNIFLRDTSGNRPVFGGTAKFQTDPYWKDNILFYEYFHGDNGAGLGASHQTGWTGLIARLIQLYGTLTPKDILETRKRVKIAFRK